MAAADDELYFKAEAYCEHIRELKRCMARAEANYAEAASAADGVMAVRYDVIGGTARRHGDDAMVAAVERIKATGADMAEKIAAWAAECEAFDDAMERITPLSALVLSLYYRNGLKWDEVAEKMGFSCSYVRQELRVRALAELSHELPWNWR